MQKFLPYSLFKDIAIVKIMGYHYSNNLNDLKLQTCSAFFSFLKSSSKVLRPWQKTSLATSLGKNLKNDFLNTHQLSLSA